MADGDARSTPTSDTHEKRPTDGHERRPTPAGRPESTDQREAREVEQHVGSHGHSTAAWTAVGTIMLGSFVACLAVVLALIWLFVVGVVIIVVGGVLGKVLHGMGFGENAHELPPDARQQGVR